MSEPAAERKSWSPDDRPQGLECRKCGCRHFYVDHTRRVMHMIVRYRRCRHCGARMTTCEQEIDRARTLG